MPSRALREWRTNQRTELDRMEATLRREAADRAAHIRPAGAAHVLEWLLTEHRLLNRGNASARTLEADFGRMGVPLWANLVERDQRNLLRRQRLEQLNTWRNAVAHGDFTFSREQAAGLVNTSRSLRSVRIWRASCSALASQIDAVMHQRLVNLFKRRPW